MATQGVKNFTAQDEKKQNDEISKMLGDKSGAEPHNLEILATRLSALTYCHTVGEDDSKISERSTLISSTRMGCGP